MKNKIKKEERKKGMVYVLIAAIVIIVGAIAFFKPKADTKYTDISQPVLKEAVKAQAESVIARIDITTKLADAEKSLFEVYVDGSDIPEKQAKWMNKNGYQGFVVQKKGNSADLNITVLKAADINLVLRGIRNDGDENSIEQKVTYTSLVINGKEILPEATTVWHSKSYRYKINAKPNDLYKIVVKWQEYNEQ